MSDNTPLTAEKYDIRWDDGTFVHAATGARMVSFDPGTFLVWTKCSRDVPANAGTRAPLVVSCPACVHATGVSCP